MKPVIILCLLISTAYAAVGDATTAATTAPPVYSVDVLLRHVENPSGLNAAGDPCSLFAFAGAQCKMQLTASITSGGKSKEIFTNEPISTDSNKADLEPVPFHATLANEQFEGFTISVKLEDCSQACVSIDSYDYNFTRDGVQGKVSGYETYTHWDGNTVRSSLTFAYIINAASVQTTVAATTAEATTAASGATTPTTTPTTPVETTTAPPIPGYDCDNSTQKTSGVQNITLSDGSTVKVYCDFGKNSSTGMTVIQSRGPNDKKEFNNDLAKYNTSFGEPGIGNSYWFGLENMRIFTQGKQYVLIIDLCCGKTSFPRQVYHNFEIGSAPDYTLTATADVPSIGLAYYSSATEEIDIGSKFQSANTTDQENCEVANYYGTNPTGTPSTGAWWFGSCANNLNGEYVSGLGSSCQGNINTTHTTGIEMRRDNNAGDDDTDKVMYDRVRMAVVPKTADFTNLPPAADFCAGL